MRPAGPHFPACCVTHFTFARLRSGNNRGMVASRASNAPGGSRAPMPPRAMPQVVTGTPEGVSLEALLVRVAGGDQHAFRLLYERSSGRLFAICLRIARERSLAEDFLQEAYARIWERSRQFDATRGSALAWMIAITRNHAIDVIRVRQREVALPDEDAIALADPKAG